MSVLRGLPPAAFVEAFPFHLWLDAQLCLIQAGALIVQLLPTLRVGAPPFGPLRLLKPSCPLDAEALREHESQLFVLEAFAIDMRLRGQLICVDEDDSLVLLLSPRISDEAELGRWDLGLADFPLHSPISDQLALIRSLRTGLDDTRRLAQRFEAQHRELTENRQRIELYMNQTPMAIIGWNTEGEIVSWNPAAARLFELPLEQALGRGIEVLRMRAVLEPGEHEAHEGFTLLTEHQRLVLEHDLGGDGPLVTGWHNTNIVDPNGLRAGVASIIRDVTEARRAAQAALERQKLESLGLLAGGVAHDFNNMLAALLGTADIALLEAPPDSPLIPHLEEIASIAERAADLTRQLLDYTGRGDSQREPVDLCALITEMRPLLEVSISKQIALEFDLRPELPAIAADLTQLRQALMNLVINAAEAIGEGQGRVRVEVSLERLARPLDLPEARGGSLGPGAYLRLSVTDDGAGMSPETLDKIFDPFFTTKFTGRGLGLASLQGIVRTHHGAMLVDSELGHGTCFCLLFPALDHRASAPLAKAPAPTREAKGRLLVVDDEQDIRRMLRSALGGLGFEVVAAKDGAEALSLIARDPRGFDLVLTDLTMPGVDGHALFAALVDGSPGLPVVVSSGYDDLDLDLRDQSGRPVPFLKKPYRLTQLLATIHEAMRRE
ncbi:response regulator [Pseudenhygromyxa sp. WMMC2535]|uniref:ATP-binding protein n=1 Tax=Pseudenhygromyxa sp. WMMC2535 TaxID=2712867 RepID=UPI0015554771|nr:ATP-binding protein [Pseudenhygromyxa sp. WMMC2535]NVB36751.1 response regulator [Pseudenhygromyxa sp. WMMC2535]